MKIIVGLGNPGAKYAGTRHNVGFAVLDELAERHNIRIDTAKHKALIGRAIMDFYKCTVEDLIVVYDDIDLDVGKLRIRQKGSAGGHNGMKNIIQHVGSQEFVRIRVGVGKKPDHMDLADYVLSRFGKEDLANIRESCGNACDAVETILADGTVAAMNKFN